MFTYAKPEDKGIKSGNIKKYIEILEKSGLSTHNVVIARGNHIVYESYWKPFHKDYLHRQYSVSKSFVSLAVGFLIQDGKMNLDDKIVDFYDEAYTEGCGEMMKKQTVRDMLMMSTGYGDEHSYWFHDKPEDRVRHYFETGSMGFCKIPGSFFQYDSPGSFVLGAVVEKITGMTFMDYLRIKMFDKIGVSKEAHCLKCPGGASWGDSAVLCTATDLLKVARFTMNYGKWDGDQLLNEEYLREATSNLISTEFSDHPSTYGYGYLIWKTQQDGFFFNGMGCQFAICVPHKDIIMIYNGDNQGNPSAKTIIIDNFFELVVNTADDSSTVNEKAYKELCEYSNTLELMHCDGEKTCPMAEKINGKTFVLDENPMGIKNIKFIFNEGEGTMEYTNAQGDKELKFGFNKNVFGIFPEEGYSDEIGTKFANGNYYKCAVSAEWQSNNTLYLNVQIIDKYFGRSHMHFQFIDENTISVRMAKTAEDFLKEYIGFAIGKAK